MAAFSLQLLIGGVISGPEVARMPSCPGESRDPKYGGLMALTQKA